MLVTLMSIVLTASVLPKEEARPAIMRFIARRRSSAKMRRTTYSWHPHRNSIPL
ncbi:hypothetical protein OK016_23720 [Vibrio chagasii]|nr:hypothetical protein [Vibrio chagasii]